MSRYFDTIAALATPVGTAAIALLRVSGPETVRLVREIFGQTPLPRLARHADYKDRAGTLLDDVLFTFFQNPASYTGEDSLEVSCHGNPFIAQKILEDLLSRGCRAASPGEFTQRAFLNGRMDLSQAEAVMDLIHARSERALAAANQQLRGALGRRLATMTDALLAALARIEAYIDFPDEDLPAEDRSLVARQLAEILVETNRLIATSHYGGLLRDGIRTVILGAPNAGKSSLLNRLVGRDRALVSPEPGTTRDFIEERIILGPHALRLIDTAGLNPSPAPLELLGIGKTIERAHEADLILHVIDTTQPALGLAPDLTERIRTIPTIVVLNKIDLTDGRLVERPSGDRLIEISALTGAGIDDLITEITKLAEAFRQDVGPELVAISARHADALARAQASVIEAQTKLNGSGAVELLASDLRAALDAIGEIVGRVDSERMLDHLFASFCIGK